MRRSTGEQDSAAPFNLRFELILAGALLAFGLLALPGLIYAVGQALLGGYGLAEDGSIGGFYADFFGDLGSFSGRAWILVLGPALTIYALRGIFHGSRTTTADEAPSAPPQSRQPARPAQRTATAAPRRARVEPRLSRD